jgi:hypothetical protein
MARTLGCPAICRDEIKQGMVHATPEFEPGADDPLNWRTLTAFFDVLEVLLRAGVTVIAEAAFQDKLWRPNLEPLAEPESVKSSETGAVWSLGCRLLGVGLGGTGLLVGIVDPGDCGELGQCGSTGEPVGVGGPELLDRLGPLILNCLRGADVN